MWIEDEPGGGDCGGDCAAAHADCALHSLLEGREGNRRGRLRRACTQPAGGAIRQGLGRTSTQAV